MTTLPCPNLISLGISAKAQKNFVEDFLYHINLSTRSKGKGQFDSASLIEARRDGSGYRKSVICASGNSPRANSGETNDPDGPSVKVLAESGAGASNFDS